MKGVADIGMIGLGVMGRNLSLNLADCGYRVAMFDRTAEVARRIAREFAATGGDESRDALIACATVRELVSALKRPRVVIVLVPAGGPVDSVCAGLIAEAIEPDDIVVDCGNSLFTDTARREQDYRGKLTFFGSGISGGAEGARHGPSLMPGGDQRAWQRLKPIWEAIAAKVDPATGREMTRAGERSGGEPCAAYIGPGGAGHYVKMVHNGIEYADMQLIAEAYHLLREVGGFQPREIADVFREWNGGELESYLIEVTAEILERDDPMTGRPLVDVVLDAAGQKGTGAWSAINAMELGVATPTIAEAVFARSLSGLKEERVHAAGLLPSPSGRGAGGEGDEEAAQLESSPSPCPLPKGEGSEIRVPSIVNPRRRGDQSSINNRQSEFIAAIGDALYCAKVCAYAQGFAQMAAASREYRWDLDLSALARIWRGGCIIRARVLQKIVDGYARDGALANLLIDPSFIDAIGNRQASWRDVVAVSARQGIPAPALSSSLAYYDTYRSGRLPANLIAAQRDSFGGHGFERVDQSRGLTFHLEPP